MKLNELINFVNKSRGQFVHVDVDGTLVKSMRIPSDVQGNKLQWWVNNLHPTKIIFSRIILCAILKVFGSKLVIWTNRYDMHKQMTLKNLGLAKFLFSDFQFFSGQKEYKNNMFVIDDVNYHSDNQLVVERI